MTAGLTAAILTQGFPRGDALEIRNDRQAVARTLSAICGCTALACTKEERVVTVLHALYAGLTNDIKAVTGHIEERLHALHAAARAAS